MNLEEAASQRDTGMAHAEQGAGEEWSDYALTFILNYCLTHDTVFCDDLWAAGLVTPVQPKGLGPVIKKVAALGVIEHTGEWRKSVHSNLSVKPVWRVVR